MSTSIANIARRCGFRLRRDGLAPGKVTERQLCREVDVAFQIWEAKQPQAALRRLRQPEKVI
jgi:hypothetical protein